MHGNARPRDIVRVGRSPAFDRVGAWGAGFAHLGREPAQRIAYLVERAIKRKPIEIVPYPDLARGRNDAVKPEEHTGSEIGRRHIHDRLADTGGDQRNVGRGGERAQISDAMGELCRNPSLLHRLDARTAGGSEFFRQNAIERLCHHLDVSMITGDDRL